MSESHDIEQIARALDPGLFRTLDELESASNKKYFRQNLYAHLFEEVEAKAKRIAPLIASAREEGAREMRERAAKLADKQPWCGGGAITCGEFLYRSILALPLSPPKEG